jgi:hypothetical protein
LDAETDEIFPRRFQAGIALQGSQEIGFGRFGLTQCQESRATVLDVAGVGGSQREGPAEFGERLRGVSRFQPHSPSFGCHFGVGRCQ